MKWGRIMSWLFRSPPASADPGRFDAVLAQNIEAQHRAADAAEGVAQAADENREHVEAVVGAFNARTAARVRDRTQAPSSSGPRAVVNAAIEQMKERARRAEEQSR